MKILKKSLNKLMEVTCLLVGFKSIAKKFKMNNLNQHDILTLNLFGVTSKIQIIENNFDDLTCKIKWLDSNKITRQTKDFIIKNSIDL